MRKGFWVLALTLSIGSAFYSTAHSMDFYIEGMAGAAIPSNTESKRYDGTLSAPGISITGSFEGLVNWSPSVASGVEVGIHNFGVQGLRVAGGFSYFQLDVNELELSANGTATINGQTFNISANPNFKREDYPALGELDDEVWLWGPSFYYDFPIQGTRWAPYIGVGGGLADVRNATEATYYARGTVGVNYSVTQNLFLGLRTDYVRLGGYESEFGFYAKANDIWMLRLAAGWSF